jgi:hypothetical protein
MGIDGKLEDIPGEKVEVKTYHRVIPPNDRLLIFLVSAMDRQAGKEDWISKQYVDKNVSIDEHKTFSIDAVNDQIDEIAGGRRKVISSQVVMPVTAPPMTALPKPKIDESSGIQKSE